MVTDAGHDGSATSVLIKLYFAHLPPNFGFPALDAFDKKFNCRPVLSAFFSKLPFDEYVEGLSHLSALLCGSAATFNRTRASDRQQRLSDTKQQPSSSCRVRIQSTLVRVGPVQ